ncbi:HD-GYP domain-containing protein [Thermosipho globiformans]|uniref:HD-GYP domain-containing protein n=1 Tax=Thermosipho globiformans TaxID=380685 RepID=UPI001F49983D|nr:HD domain-containing phosphohydrolase [Thermosipho globiformans]
MNFETYFIKNFFKYVVIGILTLFLIVTLFVYVSISAINSQVQNISLGFIKSSMELLENTVREVSWAFEKKIDETIYNIREEPDRFEEFLTYLFSRAPYYFKEVYFEELNFDSLDKFLMDKLKDSISYYSIKNVYNGFLENKLYIRVNNKVYLLHMKMPTSILTSFISNLNKLNRKYLFVNSISLYTKNGKTIDGDINDFVLENFEKLVAYKGIYKRKSDKGSYEIYYPVAFEDAHSLFGPLLLNISINFSIFYRVFYFLVLLFTIFIVLGFLISYRVSRKISRKISNDFSLLIRNIERFRKEKSLYKDGTFNFEIKEMNKIASEFAKMAEEVSAYMQELNAANQELESSYSEIEKINKELEESYIYFSSQLAMVAEGYDENTGNHIERVGILSAFIAEKMGFSQKIVYDIRYYAPLHDIGKIFVPREILLKKGKLTEEEWEEMKKHTIYGARLIGDKEQFKIARNIALYHHENYDGTGYPYGLEKEEIPIEAMITHIVDVYDALRSERPYKKSFTHEEAMKIILEGDGRTQPSHFAPEVLEVFKRYEKEIEKIWNEIYLN